jgi:hypothetical protein
MSEKIIDVYWEGLFKWGEHEENIEDCHVLYTIFGFHPVYGDDALLYIGKTRKVRIRMVTHAWWIEDEYDDVSIRVASLGEIQTWDGWDENERYGKPDSDMLAGVEALLINAHQPAYNQTSKDSMRSAEGLRVFNTGRIGSLLPEISYRYHNSRGDW